MTDLKPANELMTAEEAFIPIVIKVKTQEKTQTLILDARQCSDILSRNIRRYMGETGGESNPEAKALARLMKMTVKGALLAVGPALLKFVLGPGHPRPGKQDDLIEWYANIFAKMGIAQAVKTMTNLLGEQDGNSIRITEIHTESNPRFAQAQPE